MKTIGLLGGMSWESTTEYYRVMNETVREKLGGLHSARILILSVDFAPLADHLADGNWPALEKELSGAACSLVKAGADFLVLATNTMHQVAGPLEKAAGAPLLHIADAAGDELIRRHCKKVGLLGTRPTMEMDFYLGKLRERGLDVCVPEEEDRAAIHRIIFDELCRGIVSDDSRRAGLAIINRLADCGAEAVLLACTELGLLFRPEDTDITLLDTALLHARAAALKALNL